jgi:ketosteroid isomerase-like protein
VTDTTTQPVSRLTVQAFYQAYVNRDRARLADMIDDDVDWVISGPVDLMQVYGRRRGKAEVLELFAPTTPERFQITGYTPETLLIDGDRAAMLGRINGTRRDNDRRISFQLAHFVRFRDGKVVEFRSLIDSFDAAEQLLGHAIDLGANGVTDEFAGDLVTV